MDNPTGVPDIDAIAKAAAEQGMQATGNRNPQIVVFPDFDPHVRGAGYWVGSVLRRSEG